jgi:ribosomal RNA-processing protein 8
MPLFETPGWSLSADLLKSQPENAVTIKGAAAPSKKRKRGKGKKEEAVTGDNVGDLWRQHVEGIAPPPKEKPARPVATGANSGALGEESAPVGGDGHKQKKHKRDQAQPREPIQAKEPIEAQDVTAEKSERPATSARPAKAAISTPKITMPPPPPKPEVKLTPLQAAMRQKLVSARFRHLNETLYTTPSIAAQALLEANPTFFDEYHSGFRQQVQTWPQNPVDGFVEDLQERGQVKTIGRGSKGHAPPATTDNGEPHKSVAALPRTSGTCIVADLGCGDAKLASLISGKIGKKCNIKVLSYDLQSPNKLVTKADIANLPLEDGTMDIAIFCLALMGTNWIEFIDEAYRILHWKGELWIAEIKSRFGRPAQKRVDHSVGNRRKKQPTKADNQKSKEEDERNANEQLMVEVDGADGKVQTDVTAFVEVLRKRGFVLQAEKAIDMSNKMFVKMKFLKAAAPIKGKNAKEGAVDPAQRRQQKPGFVEKPVEEVDEASVLKPCLYKIR